MRSDFKDNDDISDKLREVGDLPLGQHPNDSGELMLRVAKGDEKALEEFYNAYFISLYRFVFYRVGYDHHHAEEVVHDTFMEAVEKATDYNPTRGSLSSWLKTISRNRIRSCNAVMMRPREMEKTWESQNSNLEEVFTNMEKEPGQKLDNAYISELVDVTLGKLPQEYSRLLQMKYVANQSIRDIAQASQRTEKSVESQLARARNAFRDIFNSLTGRPAAELGF
ncbi:MAG: RNA polymerase sigma factor [Planctomycetota bacterium]|jgi:RNA polymerase sigma-70 factor (ECF subfamily)|nr:RNA polymerase sigma factor [Planctomycetota bacterium]